MCEEEGMGDVLNSFLQASDLEKIMYCIDDLFPSDSLNSLAKNYVHECYRKRISEVEV